MATRDWNTTVERVHRDVPEAVDINWELLFKTDPKILGSIINDIIKVSVSKKGRPGKRSADSAEQIAQDLSRLRHEDYSMLTFVDTVRIQMQDRSIRQVANVSGLDKMVVHRLASGKGQPPTIEHLEAFAKAFKKDPSYFSEYRAMFICNTLYSILVDNGDSSVVFYNKLRRVNVSS